MKKFGFAFWQSQQERLKDLYYNQKLSSNQIGEIYGCYGETITSNMNKLGFKLRQIGDENRPNALYGVNTHFFNEVNKEIVAYVLGYTLCDGHVTNDGKLMYCAKDKDIIYKIRDVIESTHPIKTKTQMGNNYYSLSVSAKSMCKDLWALGFTNNKTYNVDMSKINDAINKENLRHLLRGMIDADGSISCSMNEKGRNKTHTMSISFTKNKDVCIFVSEKLRIVNKLRDEGNGIYTIRTSNKDKVIEIGHYLYDDATIYLDRKKNKFDEICQIYSLEK